ncbi:hypothetical protein [Streptomyces sp. NPDC000229]|uniref:hypothetical protein n=1 Tax=Streptomyces sp. NPDC000229 TaxID=3154247 RepID=UPI003333C851
MGHRNRTTRHRGMVAAAALLAAAGTTLAVTPAGATTAPGHGTVADQMCRVTADGVRYRSGPGTQVPALVGVIGNVWIHESFLSC